MEITIVQASWRGNRINSIPVRHVINATDDGRNSRANLMADAWNDIKWNCPSREYGIMWLAPDVVLDPDDLAAMLAAIEAEPGHIYTGLVKLWPASTGRDDWMWSHRTGTAGAPVATQDENAPVAYVSMDCVWTPGHLLEACFPAGRSWQWYEIDVRWSEIAASMDIPMHTVPGCRPKHLHFTREHNDITK